MTTSRENQRPGSFKGVKLIIDSVTTKEGVKRATYLFLNSKRRTQKPLGYMPPVFIVRGHTYGADGDSYEEILYEGYGPGGVAVLRMTERTGRVPCGTRPSVSLLLTDQGVYQIGEV